MNNGMSVTNGQAGNFGISKAGGKRSFSRKKEESLLAFSLSRNLCCLTFIVIFTRMLL